MKTKGALAALFIIAVGSAFLTISVYSATICVPMDYPFIQVAIDAASDGDTVLVADGVYTGSLNKNLSFGSKSITITSENGAEFCIIDCRVMVVV